MKRHPAKWDKILANEVTDKGLICKMYSSCSSISKKEKQLKQGQKI